MTTNLKKIGDVFLLFHELPFEFDEDLPLDLGPNVCLDVTPQDLLDAAEPALTDFVLPGYHLPGIGLNNCCLRCHAGGKVMQPIESKAHFFNSIAALRLRAPIGIEIAGQFEFRPKPEGDILTNPELFQLVSVWQPLGNARYTGKDIHLASEIATHIVQLEKHINQRLMSAIVLFSQVTCGLSKSFQMAYLGLFAALEALFAPQGKKADTLARRVAKFLDRFDSDGSLEKWLSDEYKHRRSQLTHGIQNVRPWTKTEISKLKAFGKLHEITRLCILGFLSMEDDKILSLSGKTGSHLQKELEAVGLATGAYLEEQSMWLG